MHVFKDNTGREWTVEVNMLTVKRVKNLLDVNIADLNNQEVLNRMQNDMFFVVDLLYVVCKPQADKLNISDEEFAAGLLGDSLVSAIKAFLNSYIDFFPPKIRRRLKAAQELTSLALEKTLKAVDQALGIQTDT